MRALFVSTLVVLLGCVGLELASEALDTYLAGRAIRDQRFEDALTRSTQMVSARPIFLVGAELRREEAAYGILNDALKKPDYSRAVTMIGIIRSGSTSGFEDESESMLARLPQQQIQWTAGLIDANRFDEAIESCTTMRRIYTLDSAALDEVRDLEASSY